MTDTQRLTTFQEHTEAALVAALTAIDSSLVARRLEGVKEMFVRATLGGTDAQIFIYNDEAGLLGSDVDRRFEVPDYRDGGALTSAFVQAVVAYLSAKSGRSAGRPGPGPSRGPC